MGSKFKLPRLVIEAVGNSVNLGTEQSHFIVTMRNSAALKASDEKVH